MKEKMKQLANYYKPYRFLFWSDMVVAVIGAGITLVIPLIVRYITNHVIHLENPLPMILKLAVLMLGLVVLEAFCNFYQAYYGHIMGAKMERDMRAEIFEHYQKLSFHFYDNQKVGQLLSRITNDLFEISELLHHGPEDVVISLIKFVGSFIILCTINPALTLVTAADSDLCFPLKWKDEAGFQASAGKDRGYQYPDRGQPGRHPGREILRKRRDRDGKICPGK